MGRETAVMSMRREHESGKSVNSVEGEYKPIEHIMLNHEEYIKHHRKQSKAELRWIAEYRGPIICNRNKETKVI